MGTGFVIGRNGMGLTAAHVATEERHMWAEFENGTTYDIEVIHSHAVSDFALIRLKNARNLPTISLARSGGARRGEQVVHIGSSTDSPSPLIEVGYINHTDSVIIPTEKLSKHGDLMLESGLSAITTTGAVRPGFSGGPVINMDGEVVCLIATSSGTYEQSYREYYG
jgi:S1-C subfamily serine protease